MRTSPKRGKMSKKPLTPSSSSIPSSPLSLNEAFHLIISNWGGTLAKMIGLKGILNVSFVP